MMNYLFLFSSLLAVQLAVAQAPTDTAPLPESAWAGYNVLGQLATRDAKDIRASTWSIGGETLDRDYTDYQSYKPYLGPLGAKRIRLQGGWAKCEKVRGQYDFAWLDAVIPDAASRSVAPWVSLSYGNPIYEGGGEAKLAGLIPSSVEGLAAWDNWVRAMVTRYKQHVREWEIWNEPDLNRGNAADKVALFYIRTARVIRAVQPDARLIAIGLSSVNQIEFMRGFMETLKRENALDLIDVLTYHNYSANPDESYPRIEKMQALIWSYKPNIEFMQGENGAPSTPKTVTIGALREWDWSELTQAKWNLRRMLGDHGRGIATNLFTISDVHYRQGDHMVGVNTKGLLQTNPDKTIKRPKLAYRAAQHVFTLFDTNLERLPTIHPTVTVPTVQTFVYRHKPSNRNLLVLWGAEARPADTYVPKPTDITVTGTFKKPVLVDLITGTVYELPRSQWRQSGKSHTFTGIPVPDYPVLVADKAALHLN